jgi:hypothetical protein
MAHPDHESILAHLDRSRRHQLWVLVLVFIFAVVGTSFWIAGRRPAQIYSAGPIVGAPSAHTDIRGLADIDIPIQIATAPIKLQLEQQVPLEVVQWGSKDGDWKSLPNIPLRWQWQVHRDTLNTTISGGHIVISTPIRYGLRGCAGPAFPGCAPVTSCGDPGPGDQPWRVVEVSLTSDVVPSPDWRFESTTTSSVVPQNTCVISILGINVADVTSQIVGTVSNALTSKASEVDQEVRTRTNIKSQAQMLWSSLQQPIQLSSNVWLRVHPFRAHVTPFVSNGDIVSATVGLTAYPEVSVGPKPPPDTGALPPLETGPTEANGFHVAVLGDVPYSTATQILNSRLKDSTFTDSALTGGKVNRNLRLRVTNARVYPSQTKLVAALDVDGSIKGTLYFEGTPTYSTITREVVVPDFDYTAQTAQVIPKAMDWILHGRLVQIARAASHFPLGPQVDSAATSLAKALNRQVGPNVEMHGAVYGLRVSGLAVGSDAILATVSLDGEAKVRIF